MLFLLVSNKHPYNVQQQAKNKYNYVTSFVPIAIGIMASAVASLL
jgi:hypothetical protein